MKPEQIARLPKWAQDHIARLERDAAEWKRRALEGSVEDSNVTFERGIFETYGLPKDTRVKFHLDGADKAYLEAGFGLGWGNRIFRNMIEVRSGRGTLVVQPSCSNVIHIGVDTR